MDQPRVGQASALEQEATAAIARGELQRAQDLLGKTPRPWDQRTLKIAAMLAMARHQWDEAIGLLEKFDGTDADAQVRLTLARNLGAIQRCRPDLYETLRQPGVGGRYQLAMMPSGAVSIARLNPGANPPMPPVILSLGADPRAAARRNVEELAPTLATDKPLALLGIGDGHLLAAVAEHRPRLLLDQALTVHLFEPDAELVMQCLMVHDMTAPDGPIRDARFAWHVGSQWQVHFERAITAEPAGGFLPLPQVMAIQGAPDEAIKAGIAAAVAARGSYEQQAKRRVRRHYDRLTDHELAAAFTDTPRRRPRVLVLTSRFTTVLRYSAAEAADAFTALGWETHLLMEPGPHHRLQALAILDALDRVKPDAVFGLDHLRAEQAELLPPALPYICWVQDLMPNLTNSAAGVRVGRRDFVMSFATPLLVDIYLYPPRQCIDVPMMMARRIDRPPHWDASGPDLAYVSHLSGSGQDMTHYIVEQMPPPARTLAEKCCAEIIGIYDAGRTLPSMYDLGVLVDRASAGSRMNPTFRKGLIDILWNPLNIGLYRQQALAWVAQAALDMKLELAVYGNGWDRNPRFAGFARGTIDPGRPLEQLVRSTRINLNLEPYPCTTHSRLLNGLCAGGFYLVRQHPANTLLPELANFLDEHAPPDCPTAEAARRALPPKLRGRLEDILARAAGVSFTEPPEPVKQVRCYQRAGVIEPGSTQLLPHLDEVSFADEASCRARIERFIADPEAANRIAQAQRASVEKRLSVDHGIERVVRWIGRLLIEDRQAATAVPA